MRSIIVHRILPFLLVFLLSGGTQQLSYWLSSATKSIALMGQGQEEEEETEQQDPQSKYVVISSVDWVLPLLLSCSGKSLPQISLIYEGGYKHVVSPPPEV